jgi:glutaredoxin
MKIEVLGNHETCAPCRNLSETLGMQGVEHVFKDMGEQNDERTLELRELVRLAGGRTIPALFIDGVYQKVATAKDKLVELGVLH